MRFFIFISLFGSLLLGIAISKGLHNQVPEKKWVPQMIKDYHRRVKNHFVKRENANVLFSFITGEKSGISPYTKKAFKRLNLLFLLSPSGIHLAGFLWIFSFFIKKIRKKWIQKAVRLSLLFGSLFGSLFLPQFYAVHRGAMLRLLLQFNFMAKLKLSLEHIFLVTFLLAFFLGHFQKSPLSFIFSFMFLGTFFSLRNFSKLTLIFGLFSTQLIIGLFMGEKVSLPSIPLGLIISFLFTFLLPLFFLFLATFWLIEINWIEPVIRSFILLVQTTAKYLNGTFSSSSLFLILAVWILMTQKHSKKKCVVVFICLLLHTNTAMTPSIFAKIT